MKTDFYEVLGLSKEERALKWADFEKVLKEKYKKLALKWHPDRFATKSDAEKKRAEEKFKEISEAYNTLSDENKKREYDMQNIAGGNNPFGGFNPYDNDFDPFSMFRSRSRGMGPKRPDPIMVDVYLTAQELYSGCKGKTIKYERPVPCSHCNGTGSSDGKTHKCSHCDGKGFVTQVSRSGNMQTINTTVCQYCGGTGKEATSPCSFCLGSGQETKTEEVKIDINPGTMPGKVLVLQGMGTVSDGSVPGDLYVTIRQSDEDKYTIFEDGTVSKIVNIPLFDSLLGTTVDVDLLSGNRKTIKVPELMPEKYMCRFDGEGFPMMEYDIFGNTHRHSRRSPLIVQFHIIYPEKLTGKQKEYIKKAKNDKVKNK